jgi:hypothetical protein
MVARLVQRCSLQRGGSRIGPYSFEVVSCARPLVGRLVGLRVSRLAPGPDGNLWFTEYNAGKIGRVTDAPLPPAVSVQPASGPPGTVMTISGGGYGSFESVRITFRDSASSSTVLGTVRSQSDGSFYLTAPIPQTAARGGAKVTALGLTSRLSGATRFKVTI